MRLSRRAVLTIGQVLLGSSALLAQSYTISSITKPSVAVNGGLATLQRLGPLVDVAKDGAGNLYIAPQRAHRVYKVDSNGITTVFAGNGIPGNGGDGGPAVSAQLWQPQSLAIDAAGNVYIADYAAGRIRKVNPSGVISTFAGAGSGNGGDGSLAIYAQFGQIVSVRVDHSDNVYVADRSNNRIRRITTDGKISAFAGNGNSGFSGDGGPAQNAQLNLSTVFENQIAVDGAGNVYVADTGNHRVRKIDTAGIITTIAGTGAVGFSGDNGPATAAQLAAPRGVAVDSAGDIYVADSDNRRVRKITGTTISTFAGNGNCCNSGDGGPATAATFNAPVSVIIDAQSVVFIVDMWNSVRKVAAGIITHVAGQFTPAFSGDGGPALNANVGYVPGTAVDSAGNVYIADAGNNRIRKIDVSGNISTAAGNGISGYSGDTAAATLAQLSFPTGVWVSSANEIYIADTGNHRIRKVNSVGIISTIAGNGASGFSGDAGAATSAQLNSPSFAILDVDGNLLIADRNNNRVRKVVGGTISTFAGGGATLGDGGPATAAQLNCPSQIATDPSRNVYVSNQCDNRLRKIDSSGIITTLDTTPSTTVTGVTIDGNGTLYYSNYGTIYRLPSGGVRQSIAGIGYLGYSGDNGPALTAGVEVQGLSIDGSGRIYFGQGQFDVVRRLTPLNAGQTTISSNPTSILLYTNTSTRGPLTITFSDNSATWSAIAAVTTPPGATWLSVSGTSGIGATTIDVIANVSGLAPGSYLGNVTLSSPNGVNTVTVPVTVVVPGVPSTLSVNRNSLTFTTSSIGVNPSSQTLNVINVGSTAVNWSATAASTGSFLGITPVSGAGTGSMTVTATAGALAAGTYTGTITISMSGSSSPITVPVYFQIAPPAPTPYTVSTVAGLIDIAEGGVATSQPLPTLWDLARDSQGNIYFAAANRHKIYKVTPGGILTTFAGTGNPGFSGDGAQATSAMLYLPRALAIDSSNNVYIADQGNHRIRRVAANGVITTLAGTGTSGFSGDGGLATMAGLSNPAGISIDSSGVINFIDGSNARIRRISTNGVIRTISGTGVFGFSGNGGPATSANINPFTDSRIAVDSSGNIYFADSGNHLIRRIDTNGVITSVAGNGTAGFAGDNGPPLSANLRSPRGIAVDSSGNLLIADTDNSRIRKVSGGVITTVAGGGGSFAENVAPTTARLIGPYAVIVDPSGDFYFADTFGLKIRKVAGNAITSIAGQGPAFSGDGATALQAALGIPQGISVDLFGNVYIADFRNNRIRKIAPNGVISTIAGTATAGFSGDGGPATSAQLNSPNGVFADPSGVIYIADSTNNRIRKIDVNGIITTIAGDGATAFSGDGGPALLARFNFPTDVAVDPSGNIYIADLFNRRVRKIVSDGSITTIAGNGASGSAGDGGLATGAQLSSPRKIAIDSNGVLYISDTGNNRLRRVETNGTINLVATNAGWGLAIDPSGNVFYSNVPTVTRLMPNGTSQSITAGLSGYSGENQYARVAAVHAISMAVQTTGDLFFVDDQDNLVRKLSPSPSGSVGLVASPTSSTFVATASALSTSRSITITQDGAGVMTWIGSGGVVSGGNWLTVTSGSGSGNGTLSYQMNAAGLSAGTYSGVLNISSPQAINTTTIIPVQMIVPPPLMLTSPTAITARTFQGGPSPTTQLLVVSNGGTGPFTFNAAASTSSGGNWLSVSPTSGSSSAGALMISFATTSLAAGVYSGDITLTSPEAAISPIGVPVTLTVTSSAPYITVDRNNVLLTSSGPGVNPGSQTVNVGSFGGALNWTATATVTTPPGGNWLSVNPGSGSGAGAISISGAVGSLTAGVYSGVVTITAAASNSPVAIPVFLRVGPSGGLYTLSTIAGRSVITEGGAANAQPMSTITGVAYDSSGNLYFVSSERNKVFKVTPAGVLTTFAGSGATGFGGDGGPAPSAQLTNPSGVAVDNAGNVYISDTSNSRIRKVDANGIMSTIAGANSATSSSGFSGDGGLAIFAQITRPLGMVADNAGNLYFSDNNNHRIRKISNGRITTIAGNGTATFAGDSGPATSASLSSPFGLALDSAGNIYVADTNNHRIRRIDTNGIITTFAGTGAAGFSGDGGTPTAAQLSSPAGVLVDGSGNVYIADANNQRVRKVSGGVISTIAGSGTSGFGGDGAAATAALMRNPTALALDPAGDLVIADRNNNKVRKVSSATGNIQTIAGSGSPAFAGDGGAATSALLSSPLGLVLDRAGNIYFSDANNHRIRKIDVNGTVTTIAGTGAAAFGGDNVPASGATLSGPQGLAMDAAGTLYLADTSNQRIRKILPNGIITTVAGTGTNGFNGNGIPATSANLSNPIGVAVDAMGQVYIAEQGGHRVRKVLLDGTIVAVAGNGTSGLSGDGGPALLAQVASPRGVAVDAIGNLYIADASNNRTRKVDTAGNISTVNTIFGVSPGGQSIALDIEDTLYISASNRIATVTSSGITSSLGGAGFQGFSGDGGPASLGTIHSAVITVDPFGQVIFGDNSTHVIRRLTAMPPGQGQLTVFPTYLNIRTTATNLSNLNVTLFGGPGFGSTWTMAANVVSPAGGNWLSLTSTQGPGGFSSVGVFSNATGLTPGTYYATVTFSSTDAQNTVSIPVSLTVLTPTMSVSPTVITTMGGVGAPNPAPQNILTSNLGAGTYNFTATQTINTPAGGSWFSVNPGSGASGSSLIVSFNTAGLAAGAYNGSITLTSAEATNAPVTIPVNLTMSATSPAISVSANGMFFHSPTPGSSPSSQTFAVSNGGGGSLNWTASASSSGWLSVAPASGTGNGNLSVSVTEGSLAAGTYTGNVTVSAAGAVNSPVDIPVVYQVGALNTGPYTISRFAGSGSFTEGGPTAQPLPQAYDIAVDSSGTLYVALTAFHRVVKVVNNTLVTVAGSGQGGWGGDGGPATAAHLGYPAGLGFDSNGNLYIADIGTNRIRRVDTQGIITTIAGNGENISSGDGGPAIYAGLATPAAITADSAGNLYVPEFGGNRVRKIAPNGIISTFAGTGVLGYSGDGGPATAAGMSAPSQVTIDGAGNFYVATTGDHRVRKIDLNGIISTFAGNGTAGSGGDDGPATAAQLNAPQGLAWLAPFNALLIATRGDNKIRFVDIATGIMGTAAGTGVAGFSGDGGDVEDAQLNLPTRVVATNSEVYIADRGNQRVRKVDLSSGIISTVVGSGVRGNTGEGGPATSAMLDSPRGKVADASGNIYIAIASDRSIRKVAPNGVITTFVASMLTPGETNPAPANLLALAIDAAGNLYVADATVNRVRKITSSGSVSIIAGTGTANFTGDGGPATAATFRGPSGIAVDAAGNVYIADTNNHRIRRISAADGTIATIAGTGSAGFSGDGGSAFAARLQAPMAIALDAAGSLYLADPTNHRVRWITPNGTISTFAGTGQRGFSGDGGPAAAARLDTPNGIGVDAVGNVYISDGLTPTVGGNTRIRRVSPNGIIETIAGTGVIGFTGDGGPALLASLQAAPVNVDNAGNLYFASALDHHIRKLSPVAPGNGLLSASPLAVNLAASPSSGPVQQPLSILLSGTGTYTWTATPAVISGPAGWLSVSSTSGSGGATVSVMANTAGMTPGVYAGSITLNSPAPTINNSLVIPVSLRFFSSGNPVPSLTSISPTSAPVESFNSIISLTGSNFMPASVVFASGEALSTTFIDATQLAAVIPANLLAQNGSLAITVVNPAPGGGVSTAQTFVVGTVPPSVSGISPASGVINTTVPAVITGANLAGTTSVIFSGSGVSATIGTGGTSTSLPVTITIAPGAADTLRTFIVTTSAGASAPFSGFQVTPPISSLTPTINALIAPTSGLSQAVAPYFGGPVTLTVNGTNFDVGAVASIAGTDLASTRIGVTQLIATGPASVMTTAGTFPLRVTNPGGLASNAVDFKIVERGDINGNRSVNIGDALVIALNIGGINKPPLPTTVGDINMNGNVNIGDALALALFTGRLNPNFATMSITSVTPSPANPGAGLTINGSGFSTVIASNQVSFATTTGITRVIPSAATATTLTVTVPANAISGAIQAHRTDTPTAGAEYALNVSGTPTSLALTSISPFFGVAAGNGLTLSGMGFDPILANNTVLFKSASGTVGATVTSASTTGLTVTTPAGAVCGPVTVSTGGQTSNARMVTISGSSCGLQLVDLWGAGSSGEVIVLEGIGFNVVTPASNVVRFAASGGGTVTAPVLAAGGTQLHVLIPAGATQGNVTVTVGALTSNALSYVPSSPTIPSSVDVVINSANAVGSYQATIHFDKNIVTVDPANVKGGTGSGFTAAPTTVNVDNNSGTVTINHFQTGNTPTGSFTVASITFTPVAVGTTSLSLSGIVLTDTSGSDLPANRVTLSSNGITVLHVP